MRGPWHRSSPSPPTSARSSRWSSSRGAPTRRSPRRSASRRRPCRRAPMPAWPRWRRRTACRSEITGPLADYLLGQQPARDADATRGLLAESAPARGWAAGVAEQLAGVAKHPLPEVPAGPDDAALPAAERADAVAAVKGPAAEPSDSVAAAAGPAGEPAEQAVPPGAEPAAVEPAGPATPPTPSRRRSSPRRPRRPTPSRGRSSRRGRPCRLAPSRRSSSLPWPRPAPRASAARC